MSSTHYALAIHTASPELGLAISPVIGATRTHVWNLGRETSTLLHQHLADFIQPQTWTDLAFIAVARGPGGFTGTRIGVVTARTLAQQLEIPLFAVSTLAGVAWTAWMSLKHEEANELPDKSSMASDLAVQLPAQRGSVYAAIYRVDEMFGLTAVLPDNAMLLEVWEQRLRDWEVPYHRIQAEEGLGRSVSAVLELATLGWQQGQRPPWAEALPFYGQHPVD